MQPILDHITQVTQQMDHKILTLDTKLDQHFNIAQNTSVTVHEDII